MENERAEQYQGKITGFVTVTCLIAAIGGCMFGYDVGVAGTILKKLVLDYFLKTQVGICVKEQIVFFLLFFYELTS